MKVTAVMGSHRRNHSTEFFLKYVLENYYKDAEIDYYPLWDMDYRTCIVCGACKKTGVCILQDEFTPLYDSIENADEIVLATPVYFNTVTTVFKSFCDRFQSHFERKYNLRMEPFKEKDAVILVPGGSRPYEKQFGGVVDTLYYVHEGLNVNKRKYICITNTDQDPINENHKKALEFIDQSMKAEMKNQTEQFILEIGG